MPTIHFDITDVLEFARFNTTLTGIQRVLIQILSEMVKAYGADRIRLIGYHPTLQRLASWDASYFAAPFQYDHSDFCCRFGISSKVDVTNLRGFVERKYGSKFAEYHCARLILKNMLSGGREFRRRGITHFTPKHRLPPLLGDARPKFSPRDVIFVGGGTWGFRPMIEEMVRLKHSCGVRLCSFVHDLIPLLAPEHVVSGVHEEFDNWLQLLASHSDLFLANSKATANDLNAWLVGNGHQVPIHVVPLAHQFANRPRDAKVTIPDVRVSVLNAARVPYVLCVGTIESRKNVWTLANVWREIHAKLGTATPRLLFAGKHGWLKDDFDDFMRGTGSLYGYIRIVERPSDEELAYLYKNCLFSIFPSYKEGWGLPIGESLWFGRPVICSNTSSMPEVAGELADYIDPHDPQSIVDTALKMITDPAYRDERAAEIARARLRSWADVAADLWRALTDLDGSRRSAWAQNQAIET